MEKKTELKEIKICLLGDSNIGKTCIINSFFGYEFQYDCMESIGSEKIEKRITLENGKKIKLILLDCGGA